MVEKEYYPEIKKFFLNLLNNRFPNYFFWGGTKNIKNTIDRKIPKDYSKLRDILLLEIIPVDTDINIICFNQNNEKYLILILEIKVKPLKLINLSQLIGYLNVSGSFLGLLVAVNFNLSQDFSNIINIKPRLLDYEIIQETRRHIKIGLATWDHITKNISFQPHGPLQSIDNLFEIIEQILS